MGTLGWLITAVGTLGVGGFVALLFLAPTMAKLIGDVVVAELKLVLSSRIGCAALAGIACGLVGLFYGDHEGAARVQATWDAAEQVAVEHAADARTKAEAAIPPLETLTQPAAPEPAPRVSLFHLPTWFPKKAANECPPVAPRRAAPRTTDAGVRTDKFNRDNH